MRLFIVTKNRNTMFFPHKHQRCLIVWTTFKTKKNRRHSRIFFLFRYRRQKRKMNDEKMVFFGACMEDRKLDKLTEPKKTKQLSLANLLSLFNLSIVCWLSSNWSLRRAAAINPFLASCNCCCSWWISFDSRAWRALSSASSFWIVVVLRSMSRSLSVGKMIVSCAFLKSLLYSPFWKISSATWRLVSAAWFLLS